jgi:hypothetical protein
MMSVGSGFQVKGMGSNREGLVVTMQALPGNLGADLDPGRTFDRDESRALLR